MKLLFHKWFHPIVCCAVATFAGSTAGPAVAIEGSMINFYSYIYGIILYSYSFRRSIFYLNYVLKKKYFLSPTYDAFWELAWGQVLCATLIHCIFFLPSTNQVCLLIVSSQAKKLDLICISIFCTKPMNAITNA